VREIPFLQAVYDAIREEMARDDRVFVMGEDIAWPRNKWREYPHLRVCPGGRRRRGGAEWAAAHR